MKRLEVGMRVRVVRAGDEENQLWIKHAIGTVTTIVRRSPWFCVREEYEWELDGKDFPYFHSPEGVVCASKYLEPLDDDRFTPADEEFREWFKDVVGRVGA